MELEQRFQTPQMKTDHFIYESSRTFVLFSYSAGRGLLLLRSRKSNDHMTRLDILFQDVRAIELRTWFDGIRIEEVDPRYIANRESRPESFMEVGNRAYALTGTGWAGFVLGGIVNVHEDDGEYMSPSRLVLPSEM